MSDKIEGQTKTSSSNQIRSYRAIEESTSGVRADIPTDLWYVPGLIWPLTVTADGGFGPDEPGQVVGRLTAAISSGGTVYGLACKQAQVVYVGDVAEAYDGNQLGGEQCNSIYDPTMDVLARMGAIPVVGEIDPVFNTDVSSYGSRLEALTELGATIIGAIRSMSVSSKR